MTDFLYCKKSDKVEFAPTSCRFRHIFSLLIFLSANQKAQQTKTNGQLKRKVENGKLNER